MVDLPEYRRQTIAGQPAGVIGVPRGTSILDAIGVVGKQVEESLSIVALQEAEQSGARDGVQRDQNGRLVFSPRLALSKQDLVYNRAALSAYTSEFNNDHQRIALEKSQQYVNDPAAFGRFWKDHMDGALQGVPPEARGQAAVLLGDIGSKYGLGLTSAKASRDYALSSKSWSERIASVQQDLDGLAATGGAETQSYRDKATEFEGVLREGIGAGFLTEDMAKLRRNAVSSRTTALTLSNVAEQAYRAGAPPAGFADGGDYGFNIGNLRVSKAAWNGKGAPRNGFETFLTPEEGVAANFKNVLATESKLGGKMTFDSWADSWAPEADKNDPRAWAKTIAEEAGYKAGDQVPTGDPAAMAKVLRAMNRLEKGRITVPESAFADGIAMARTGSYPRRDGKAAASSIGPSQSQRMGGVFAVVNRINDDPSLNLTEAERRQYSAGIMARVGQLEAQRKIEIAEISDEAQAYTLELVAGKVQPGDGRLAGYAQRFAELGDQSQATRYRLLAEREAQMGMLQNMSVGDIDRFAVSLLEGPAGEYARTVRGDKAAAATALKVEARQDFQDIKAMVDGGAAPKTIVEKAKGAALKARQAGDPALAGDIAEYFGAYEGATAINKLPKDQQTKMIDDLRANADQAQSGVGDWLMLQHAERLRKEKIELLKSDPMRVAATVYRDELGPMASLDWSRPEGIAGALRARATSAAKLESQEGVPVLPVLADEIERMKSALDVLPADGQAQLLGALRDGLSPLNFGRLMEKVASGTPAQQSFAAAGALYATSPALARDVLAGAAALKAQPGLLPSGKGSEWGPEIQNQLGNAFSENPQAGAMAEAAMRALYAKAANDEGDRSGKLNKDRLGGAVAKVIGGPVEQFRNESLLPVSRDGGPSASEALARLADTDLPNGQPIPLGTSQIDAARIARFGVLSNAGAGRYFVRMPMDGRLKDVIDPTTGQRLVLDLRDAANRALLVRPDIPADVTVAP